MTRTLSAPGLIEQPVSVTRQMASALPGLQAMAKEKGLKVHHLGAGYPHPEVSDPTDYIARRSAFFDHLASEAPQNDKETALKETLRGAFGYTDTLGPASARQAFASVYGPDFSFEIDPDKLIPTIGATGGIAMMCSLFERSGEPLAYISDAPTYAGFVARARLSQNSKIYSAEMDEEGPIIELLKARIDEARSDGRQIAFYYTVPDGHNPGGISFSAKRREEIMALMRAEGILAVEDAPYTYISFAAPEDRPRPLVGYDAEYAVHLFTASKIGLPGPRVGFMYSEASLEIGGGEKRLLRDLILSEAAGDILFQNPEALIGFQAYLSNDDFSTRDSLWPVAAQKSAVYGENREILLSVLEEKLGAYPEAFSWTKPEAGFFSVFTFKEGKVETGPEFVNHLVAEYGVVTIPMFDFYPEDARARNPKAGLDQLRLSFCFNESFGEQRKADLKEAAEAFANAVLIETGRG